MIRSDHSLLVFSPTRDFIGEFSFKHNRFCSAFLTESGSEALESLLDCWQSFGIPEIVFSDVGVATLEQHIPFASQCALPALRDGLQEQGFSLVLLSASAADIWHQTDDFPFLSEERFSLAETLSQQERSALEDWRTALKELRASFAD